MSRIPLILWKQLVEFKFMIVKLFKTMFNLNLSLTSSLFLSSVDPQRAKTMVVK